MRTLLVRTVVRRFAGRAHAWTGDALESDPLCPYEPPMDVHERPAVTAAAS